MKFNNIIIIILFILSASLFSCTDKNEDIFATKSDTTIIDPTNTNNPYDSVGINHNNYLDLVFTEIFNKYGNPNELEVDLIKKETESIILEEGLCSSEFLEITSDYIDVSRIIDEDDVFFENLMDSELSADTKLYIQQLLSQYDISYPELDSFIRNKEDLIINDGSIQEEEKVILLSFTSVFRHSSFYWKEIEYTKKAAPKWFRITAADAKGAVAGAATGATVGALTTGGTPVGATTGAIIGGTFYAIAASVEKAASLKSAPDEPKKPEKPEEQ